jgi:hypothetical protein
VWGERKGVKKLKINHEYERHVRRLIEFLFRYILKDGFWGRGLAQDPDLSIFCKSASFCISLDIFLYFNKNFLKIHSAIFCSVIVLFH